MRLLKWLIVWSFVAIFLSGCTAMQLREANKSLVDYYTAKAKLEEQENIKPNEKFLLMADIHDGFFHLSEDAAKEAKKPTTKKLNQIAFYRIAATAAWQAMNTAVDTKKREKAKENLIEYSRKGFSECETPQNAPRDCGMLHVIPTLAGIDESKSVHDDLMRRNKKREPITQEELITYFELQLAALTDLIERYRTIATYDVHPQFLSHLKHIMEKVYCQRVKAGKALLKSELGSGNIYKRNDEKADQMEAELNALFDQETIDCRQ